MNNNIDRLREMVARKPKIVEFNRNIIFNGDAEEAFKNSLLKKECFYNALMVSISMECSLVVGYLFHNDSGLFIEHAWNSNDLGDFDITKQLFFPDIKDLLWHSLVTINKKESLRLMNKYKKVNHDILWSEKKYKNLFI